MSEPSGSLFQSVRDYIRALAGVGRWRLRWTLALMVLAPVTEGLGLALLIPTLQIAGVSVGAHSEAGRFAAIVRAALGALGLRPTLALMLVLFVTIVAVRALLNCAQTVAITAVYENFAQSLRQRLFEAVSRAGWMCICKSRSADFVHALTAEVDRAAIAAYQGLCAFCGAAVAALYIAASFVLFPAATALMLAMCAVLAFLLRARTRAVHRAGEDYSGVANAVYAAAIEHFQSVKTARIYGAQDRTCALFARLTREMAAAGVSINREQAAADAWFEAGSAAMMGATILAAIKWLAITPAEVLILLILFARVVPRVRALQSTWRGCAGYLPSFATVTRIEQQCRAAAEPAGATVKPIELRSAIRFENVSFTYPSGQTQVLRGIDLTIAAGRTVAIAGPSGAGKSTIADLLMGLMAPASGRIIIDGTPLDAERALAWREQIGYVAQDTFLFHDTVRANLLWARPDASEAEVREALRIAAADEFVARLPQGLDTVVGDRGAALSQGERQRIAIARAILRRPRLLVLDEATNSLDSQNEARILDALARMSGAVTTVLIAHRLSTLRWADLIYVVEDGRVVESGDWASLSARLDGRFRTWCVAQGLAA
jgi:ATP-binding cassette subfamily C protein